MTAVNGAGESGKSNETSAMTRAPGVTGFGSTAGDSHVDLQWSGSLTTTSYRIYRDTLGGVGGAAAFVVTGTSFTDSGLINGTTYYSDIPQMDAGSRSILRRHRVFGKPELSTRVCNEFRGGPARGRTPRKPKFLSSRRKSPVVFDRTHDNRTRYAVDITSGGRNSAISRRMLANRFFGMATSAIWNAT